MVPASIALHRSELCKKMPRQANSGSSNRLAVGFRILAHHFPQCKKIKRPNVNPAIILEDMEVLPIVEEEEVGEVVVEEVTHSPVEGSQVESEQFLD